MSTNVRGTLHTMRVEIGRPIYTVQFSSFNDGSISLMARKILSLLTSVASSAMAELARIKSMSWRSKIFRSPPDRFSGILTLILPKTPRPPGNRQQTEELPHHLLDFGHLLLFLFRGIHDTVLRFVESEDGNIYLVIFAPERKSLDGLSE